MRRFHVGIIGGGVVGSAIAWELSKYNIDVIVFEAGSDVSSEASKANSGVIHSGINSAVGSLKARFCVQGNKSFQSVADELGFSAKWVGKYVIAKNSDEVKELKNLKEIGETNGVEGLKIVDGSEVKEPNVACHSALWVPTAGITLPYESTIAFAENAAYNNVKFCLEAKVGALKKTKDGFLIKTNKGDFESNILVNAAGLNCRNIVSMLQDPDFNVYPCRGEYLVLDKNYGSIVNSMIYPVPVKELGVLGVHITPTIEGNILLGPSAEFIDDATDKKTTKETMKTLIAEAKEIIPKMPTNAVINAYSGIRCKLVSAKDGGWADYRIEESKENPGVINLLGIESPGLTAAPAIGKYVVEMISKSIDLKADTNYKSTKIFGKRFSEMSQKEQSDLIKKDERWGRVVCRCEQVTEAEIIKALSNPLNAKTLASVKYRCRAGMGRCQGGFCTQHIVRIMEEEFRMGLEDIKLKSADSYLFTRRNREVKHD